MDKIKAVLVTGASTGIGRKITERLASDGHLVYAGARKDSDLRALESIENVQPIRFDVTCAHDIAAAVDLVTRAGHGLYGLVNNAGVFTLGPVNNGNDAEFDLTMEVNIRAPYYVTKSFVPSIIAARGRIVLMGSVCGVQAVANASAYSMSKHAIEALTDSLAEELEPLGVCVSIIEPGSYKSEIAANALGRSGENPLLPDFFRFKEPDDVADAVTAALFGHRPKRRYLVVPDPKEAEETIRKHLAVLVQLNADHPYSYDRSALVKMLDEALALPRSESASMKNKTTIS